MLNVGDWGLQANCACLKSFVQLYNISKKGEKGFFVCYLISLPFVSRF